MPTFRTRILPLLIAHLVWQAAPAQAQTPVDAAVGATIPLAFAGDDTRIGVGYDSRHKLTGEAMQVLTGDDRSAWIGEAWVAEGAGGLKLDYHWLNDSNARVGKLFAAWDRNRDNDQKISVGGGAENESWFWGAYGSFGITGRRDLGTRSSAATETRQGTDASLGDYLQDFTTTTTVRSFERAYEYGLGARVGRFYDQALIRLVAGLDHEWGAASSSQTTASIGLEKFFYGSPHSILVSASVSDRQGDFELDRHDRRIGVFWRYQFGGKGGGWQPTKSQRRVEEPGVALAPARQLVEATPAAAERKVVKMAESVSAETFFDLNQASLRPEAGKVLDALVAKLKGSVLDGSLRVTGHTCDLGPAAYNQILSARRAAAVRDYLAASGALPADRITAVGKGEDDPKYPNSRAGRSKNRRCDIEFGIVTESVEEVPAPVGVTDKPAAAPVPAIWRIEENAAEPAWRRRALRNPITHKREVDAYREQETLVTVSAGERLYLNQAPIAQDDYVLWLGSRMPAYFNVLTNDSDPDGDSLTVVAVTNGSNGTATILGNGQIQYMWTERRPGFQYFTYTVSDGKGGLATARITLTIVDP